MHGSSFRSPAGASRTPASAPATDRREVSVIGRLVTTLFVLAFAARTEAAAAQHPPRLPPAIDTAFRQSYPGARILNVSRELRNKQVVYEVESQDGATRRDLVYDLNGQAIEIEETIPADSLPAAVRAALGRDAPGAVIVRAERVTSAALVSYEVLVRLRGQPRSLSYDSAGRRQ